MAGLKRPATALALLAACSYPRYSPGTHYFASANLYLEPPIPTTPITKERAQELAHRGYGYYEAEYDQTGLRHLWRKAPDGKSFLMWDARSDGGMVVDAD